MTIHAIMFDGDSLNRFLSGVELPSQWDEQLQFGDDVSDIKTFYVGEYAYVLTTTSNPDLPRAYLRIAQGKLLSGLASEAGRIEALQRILSVAQRYFEGKRPIPLSWKPFSRGDIKSFQLNSRSSGETRRVVSQFTSEENPS